MRSLAVLLLLSVSLPAQPVKELSARDLYFAAAPVNAAGPTGLRYSLLKAQPNGEYAETKPDVMFQSGDRIKLTVESNQDGFLYVIHHGSSGEWYVLEGSPVAMERNRRSDVPPGGKFYFDDRPGEEKLFLVFTRVRDANLDRILQGGKPVVDPTKPVRATQSRSLPLVDYETKPAPRTVDQSLMSSLRLQSRDLVFQKVDDPPTAPKPEKAVYVVNPGHTSESRVVVDLRLQHR